MDTFQRIKDYLHENSIEFKALHHEPTRTSEASAKARGEDMSIGGKALVMKIMGEFKLFVLSAALKIDSKKIKEFFHTKRTRFANAEELKALTGLVPGAIPPFGRPILELDLYVDRSVLENKRIAFNAGSLTDSIIMNTKDYMMIANPQIFHFSKE
jgi:Ala-tRNA(Pro) deacylase